MESKKKTYGLNMHSWGSTSLIINTLISYIDVSTRSRKKRTVLCEGLLCIITSFKKSTCPNTSKLIRIRIKMVRDDLDFSTVEFKVQYFTVLDHYYSCKLLVIGKVKTKGLGIQD